MKKYAIIITCLAMLTGSLLAQTSGGSSSEATPGYNPGSSGTRPAEGATGSPSSAGLQSGSSGGKGLGQSSQGTRGPGTIVKDPSGTGTPDAPTAIIVSGTVRSEAQKREIEQRLSKMPGVNAVQSMLRVAGDTSSPSGTRHPDENPRNGTPSPSTP
jgi:hypothetical protein